jgi:hypothetical protein
MVTKMAGFDTYMGLKEPYDTIWSNGEKVTVYPNGKVLSRSSGLLIRKPVKPDEFADNKEVLTTPSSKIEKMNSIIAFFVTIMTILGIILKK